MKKSLISMAALLVALVGCNKETHQVTPADDGQAAFIQVDIKAAGTLTKATPGTYEYGSADENAVKTINFYFFDAAGNPYSVVNTGENAISWTRSEGTSAGNIEAISDVVLVIKQSEEAPPAKVVAILNDVTNYSGKNMTQLASAVVTALHTEMTDFVMSNSVYINEDTQAVMIASEISNEHIFTITDNVDEYKVGQVISADKVANLKITPIEIYVERVAAKVRVSAQSSSFNNTLESAIPVMSGTGADAAQLVDSDGNQVFAKILGWDVTNATDEAYLLKNVNASWTTDALGFNWNNDGNFRSYWAKTTDTPAHTRTFEHLMTRSAVTEDYYFENTNETEHSQLLVAAQLVTGSGAPINLAKWYNVLYTIDELKTAMINTVATKLYVAVSTTVDEDGTSTTKYRTIGVDDVVFYQMPSTTESKRYEVKVKADESLVYFKPDGTNIKIEDVNAILDAIEPAQMWNEGHAYYYLNIKHFGSPGTPGEFGIVRNHVYDIKINVDQLLGFGTPVYDEKEVIIPEKTEDQEALNLAAQINILSWHLVSQDVTLQ